VRECPCLIHPRHESVTERVVGLVLRRPWRHRLGLEIVVNQPTTVLAVARLVTYCFKIMEELEDPLGPLPGCRFDNCG
jgi:hypothetical protein